MASDMRTAPAAPAARTASSVASVMPPRANTGTWAAAMTCSRNATPRPGSGLHDGAKTGPRHKVVGAEPLGNRHLVHLVHVGTDEVKPLRAAVTLKRGQRQMQARHAELAGGGHVAVGDKGDARALAGRHDLAGERGVRAVVQVLLAHDERVVGTGDPRHLLGQRPRAAAPVRHGNAQEASVKERAHGRPHTRTWSFMTGSSPMSRMAAHISARLRLSSISNWSSPSSAWCACSPMPVDTRPRPLVAVIVANVVAEARRLARRDRDAGEGHEQAVGADNLQELRLAHMRPVRRDGARGGDAGAGTRRRSPRAGRPGSRSRRAARRRARHGETPRGQAAARRPRRACRP